MKIGLTKSQTDIIDDNNFPKYLKACAGTGKTEVIIQKVLSIIDSEASASISNFGIITFTNKATEEMKKRLSNLLYEKYLEVYNSSDDSVKVDFYRNQVELINSTEISTIHSFCEELLREYGYYIDLPTDFNIKSFRYNTSKIISDVVNNSLTDNAFKNISQFKIINVLSLIFENNNSRGIDINTMVLENFSFNNNTDFWSNFKRKLLEIYIIIRETVEKQKYKENILTPDDLIKFTVKLLQVPYVSNQVTERFKYIFIDEFQDTNKTQFEFVNILINQGVKVFLVGDDKQSVYAFRGADIESSKSMYKFINLSNETNIHISLNENFRTDETLIKIINEIFSSNFYYSTEKLDFPFLELVTPETKKRTGCKECFEIYFETDIVKTVNDVLKTKINGVQVKFSDIAILCRKNYDLGVNGNKLKNAGFPVEIVGGKSFYKSKEIIDTYKIINALLNKDDLHKNELIFTDYYSALNLENSDVSFDDFMLELKVIIRYENVEDLLSYIFTKSNIYEYYRKSFNYQAISNLEKLKELSRTITDIDTMQPLLFLDYLYLMIKSEKEEDDADILGETGVIKLYSIHKSKGLAFPIVIIPCVDNNLNKPITKPKIIINAEQNPPLFAIDSEYIDKELEKDNEYKTYINNKIAEHLEEEIRIFYVACTRAKHKIILNSTNSSFYIQNSTYWKNHASFIKWLYEIDDGKFVEKYSK